MHLIADGLVEATEFRVTEKTLHCGEKLKDIQLKKNVLIATISRKGNIEIPSGDSTFLAGDSVIIISGSDRKVEQLNDVFAE